MEIYVISHGGHASQDSGIIAPHRSCIICVKRSRFSHSLLVHSNRSLMKVVNNMVVMATVWLKQPLHREAYNKLI